MSDIERRVFRIEATPDETGSTRPIGRDAEDVKAIEILFSDIKKGDYFMLLDEYPDGNKAVFFNTATITVENVPIEYQIVLWYAEEESPDGQQVDVQAAILENGEVQFLLNLIRETVGGEIDG